jgi:hypothetical protein
MSTAHATRLNEDRSIQAESAAKICGAFQWRQAALERIANGPQIQLLPLDKRQPENVQKDTLIARGKLKVHGSFDVMKGQRSPQMCPSVPPLNCLSDRSTAPKEAIFMTVTLVRQTSHQQIIRGSLQQSKNRTRTLRLDEEKVDLLIYELLSQIESRGGWSRNCSLNKPPLLASIEDGALQHFSR